MDAALTEERNPMNIVLKGIHAVANADRLRRKMRREASIQCHTPEMGADALAGMLSDADVLIAMHVEPDLPPAPRLKMLQLPGAGYDAITWSALPADIPVCNVFEHEIGIAEYVILAMLEWNIRMCGMDSVFRTGKWEHSLLSFGSTHGELAGKTVAILGYGHIGRAITARVRAFGARRHRDRAHQAGRSGCGMRHHRGTGRGPAADRLPGSRLPADRRDPRPDRWPQAHADEVRFGDHQHRARRGLR
ncbi:MAG: hypothetical protein CMM50_07710 [Rhodospirillaceae bacterium]|nr:hypothetical protein [Rhodospirillaceae bacterium]